MAQNTVRDVMMPEPGTVDASLSIQDTAHMMRAWDIREVLVTEDGELRGLLTDQDIIVLAIASGRDPNELLAGECADPDVFCVDAGDPAAKALEHMQRYDLRRLPVVEGRQLVGSVWIADLAIEERCRSGSAQDLMRY